MRHGLPHRDVTDSSLDDLLRPPPRTVSEARATALVHRQRPTVTQGVRRAPISRRPGPRFFTGPEPFEKRALPFVRAGPAPDARLFTGPRGGRISTAVLRDATHWDEAVPQLGYEHLRRHDLRHTGPTWLADAGVPTHVLRGIAGHGSLTTAQRYLHPDIHKITAAGTALSAHLSVLRAPRSLPATAGLTR